MAAASTFVPLNRAWDNPPVDADQLRAAQAPLKERYRSTPTDAVTALHAAGTAAEAAPTFSVAQWVGPTRAGLHPATGGDGADACSGDMLLEAVLACAGVTLRSVAVSSGLAIGSVTGRATAMFDARGTLGIDRTVPVGIQDLTLEFTVDGEITDAQLERLARMTERYCVVGQSLAQPPVVTVLRTDDPAG